MLACCHEQKLVAELPQLHVSYLAIAGMARDPALSPVSCADFPRPNPRFSAVAGTNGTRLQGNHVRDARQGVLVKLVLGKRYAERDW